MPPVGQIYKSVPGFERKGIVTTDNVYGNRQCMEAFIHKKIRAEQHSCVKLEIQVWNSQQGVKLQCPALERPPLLVCNIDCCI